MAVAQNDSAGSLARLALASVICLWVVAALGLVLEGLERFASFRVLCVSGLGIGGALWWRAAKHGGLPSSLVDFDSSGTGLSGAPPRAAVLVGAPVTGAL